MSSSNTITSEQFNIQENDMVAACLMDTGSTDPIRIVGEENSGISGQVYQYSVRNYQHAVYKFPTPDD